MYRATLKGCTSVQVHQPSTSVKIWRNTGMSRRLSVFLAISWSNKSYRLTFYFRPHFLHNAYAKPKSIMEKQFFPACHCNRYDRYASSLLVSICVFTIIYLLSLNSLPKTCFVKTLLLEKQEWSVCSVHFSNACISLYQYSLSKWFIKSLSLKILHLL